MKLTHDDLLIERYLDGLMNAWEEARFVDLLASNGRLREQLKAERSIRAVMAGQQHYSLRKDHSATRALVMERLSSVSAKPGTTAGMFGRIFGNVYGRTATVLVTIGLLFLLMLIVWSPAADGPVPTAPVLKQPGPQPTAMHPGTQPAGATTPAPAASAGESVRPSVENEHRVARSTRRPSGTGRGIAPTAPRTGTAPDAHAPASHEQPNDPVQRYRDQSVKSSVKIMPRKQP